jgi:hypothetical protein
MMRSDEDSMDWRHCDQNLQNMLLGSSLNFLVPARDGLVDDHVELPRREQFFLLPFDGCSRRRLKD